VAGEVEALTETLMPKFLEDKLKKRYGKKSKIPYKIMNKQGLMKGNKITAKGRALEAKHKRKKSGAHDQADALEG
jgi:hypothetical protein